MCQGQQIAIMIIHARVGCLWGYDDNDDDDDDDDDDAFTERMMRGIYSYL